MENGDRHDTLKSQLIQKNTTRENEFECLLSEVQKLEERVMEVQLDVKCVDGLLKLIYLKSKARLIPHVASILVGMAHHEGMGLVDKHGIPLSECSKNTSLASIEEKFSNRNSGSIHASYEAYIDEILKYTDIVVDTIHSLSTRVIKTEIEAATEKDKVKLGLEENRRKTLQIQRLTSKVEEMETFALATNIVLVGLRNKFEDAVEERSRQRQRAAENERELRRVKQNFEVLMSFVSDLISCRESLLSDEQLEHVEKILDRLFTKAENEKASKEAEIHKLMEEIARLRAALDEKEAQLLATNEQYKWMALNTHGI